MISAAVTPCIGWLTDRRGPRLAVETGVVLMGSGLLLASLISGTLATLSEPWRAGRRRGQPARLHGAISLPDQLVWRRRGLALSIAFSGVGVGSVTILPWLQSLIADRGWRTACWSLGLLVLIALAPLNLLLRRKPADLGLGPDGDPLVPTTSATRHRLAAGDWASDDWTLARALRTRRFWWLALSYFCALFTWYLVQVHQTKYLIEVGFDPKSAAWALGLVSLVAVPGQIALGHLSDRIRREWVWTIGNAGFVLSCAALLALSAVPAASLLWLMVVTQGTLGYSLTSVMGAIPVESFTGRHSGSIFGSVMLAAILGGAAGPWVAGVSHDLTGSYSTAFWLAMASSALSAIAVWRGVSRR